MNNMTQTKSPLITKTKKVAIQGVEGAFHEIAARFFFEETPLTIVPAHTFSEMVKMVESGNEADMGLMAIENTIAGSLMSNYTLLNDSKLKITGEVFLRIKLNLMVMPGVQLENLEEVHSHPIALVQCREFFRQYPHIRVVEAIDTALSAKEIREKGLKTRGAVASTLAAEMYQLDIINAGIETNKRNFTRFLVLERSHDVRRKRDSDKVSICFTTSHDVGSLHKVLAVLAAYSANLTKIQSTPIIGREWEYRFFVDFVVDGEVSWQQAIDAIRPITHELNVMGNYQLGRHHEY